MEFKVGLIAIIIGMLCVSNADARFRGGFEPYRHHYSPYHRLINGINQTLQAIKSAETAGGTPLWDLLPAGLRVALLTQTQVVSIWNLTGAIVNNQTNLTWATIPANVQTILLNEEATNAFGNQTFAQWGFVDSNSSLANLTILDFISTGCATYLPTVQNLLSSINFSTAINTTTMLNYLEALNPYYGYIYNGQLNFRMGISRYFEPTIDSILRLLRAYNPTAYFSAISPRCSFFNPLNSLLYAVESCFYLPRRFERIPWGNWYNRENRDNRGNFY